MLNNTRGSRNKQVNQEQVSIMIGYEEGMLNRLSSSKARLGQPLCGTHDYIKDITPWAQEHF